MFHHLFWFGWFGWLALLPGWAQAGEPAVATHSLSRHYAATPHTTLDIANQYGSIHVHTHDSSGIALTVTVTAQATTPERAQARLDQVALHERFFGPTIQWETQIRDASWLREDLRVVYTLSLPPDLPLKLNQRHGDLHLDDREGDVDLDLRHGRLQATHLRGPANRLRLAFAQAEIASYAGGDLDLSLSRLHLQRGGDLYLHSQAAKVQLDTVAHLDLTCHLGELILGQVGEIHGEYSATNLRISQLQQAATLTASYAPALQIGEIAPSVRIVDLRGTAASFHLGLASTTPLDLDARLSHGTLYYGDDPWPNPEPGDHPQERIYHHAPDNLSRTATPPVRILIRNRYGQVKLLEATFEPEAAN